MKTQRRIIRCLLFTCAGNEYGLTDASLKTAKEITVASSLTIVSKPQRKQRMKRRGGGGKKEKEKGKEKEPSQLVEKRYFSDWRENCSADIIHRVSRASHGSVVRSFVAYEPRFTKVISESGSGNAFDVPFKLVTIIHQGIITRRKKKENYCITKLLICCFRIEKKTFEN